VQEVDWSAFEDLDPRRPGLVAAVLSGGSIEASRSAGSTEAGGDALTVSSRFYVASIAKQFTAASVATLVLDGTVGLADPAMRWLPELGESWAQVEIGHLVAHTGGLADADVLDSAAGFNVDSDFTTADRVAVIARSKIEDRPGTLHRYNNHGYVLLASIVERATGCVLGEFARSRFFEPLGMRDTRFIDARGPRSVPGWAGGTRRVEIRFTCVGDGGLVTSISDLARWDRWLPCSPLAPVMLRSRPFVEGRPAHDAWGISIRSHHGRRIESHGGSIDGYLATYVRFPELDVSFVILANTDEYGVEGFGVRSRDLVGSVLREDLDFSCPPWTETHGDPISS
jgi:CubicO group peptidase (beta-lactamase class C family)